MRLKCKKAFYDSERDFELKTNRRRISVPLDPPPLCLVRLGLTQLMAAYSKTDNEAASEADTANSEMPSAEQFDDVWNNTEDLTTDRSREIVGDYVDRPETTIIALDRCTAPPSADFEVLRQIGA